MDDCLSPNQELIFLAHIEYRGDGVADRSGVHANISLFFSQFETVQKEELFQRLFDSALPQV